MLCCWSWGRQLCPYLLDQSEKTTRCHSITMESNNQKKLTCCFQNLTAYLLPVIQNVICHFLLLITVPLHLRSPVKPKSSNNNSNSYRHCTMCYCTTLCTICTMVCALLQSSNDNCLCLSEENYLNRPYVEEIAQFLESSPGERQ